MLRFIAGLIIGIFIGTGGTMALTSRDMLDAGKSAYVMTRDLSEVLQRYVDRPTMEKIMQEIAEDN